MSDGYGLLFKETYYEKVIKKLRVIEKFSKQF